MTISNGYASLQDYKAWIAVRGLAGTVGTDTSDDSMIELLIESASRYIDRETGRVFYKDSADADYYYTAEDTTCLELPDFASITTISVDYSGTRSYTALTSTDFDLLPDNYTAEGRPINGAEINTFVSSAYFPATRRGVKVTGKRGWPAVPADVKEAALSIAQSLYNARSGQSAAGKVTVTAAGVVVRPEDVPAMAQKVIEHYRDIT